MSRRLLLVDDDPNIRETARDILEDAGYGVAAAASGAEAIALMAAGPCEVLLVDYNLPDGKGLELAARLQALHPALKVILMTGEAGVQVPDGAAPRVLATLLKPVDPAQLLELLRRAFS